MSVLIQTFAAAIVVVVVALGANPAWAHAKLLSAVPAANGTVALAPKEIALTFNEKIKLIVCTLKDQDGKDVSSIGPARADGPVLRIPVTNLIPGQYTLSYRIAGDDGHVINATMMFAVEAKP